MKNVFPAPAILFAVFNLTDCGLKGPLYFSSTDKTAPPPTKLVNLGTQSSAPDRNDHGNTGDPSQVNY